MVHSTTFGHFLFRQLSKILFPCFLLAPLFPRTLQAETGLHFFTEVASAQYEAKKIQCPKFDIGYLTGTYPILSSMRSQFFMDFSISYFKNSEHSSRISKELYRFKPPKPEEVNKKHHLSFEHCWGYRLSESFNAGFFITKEINGFGNFKRTMKLFFSELSTHYFLEAHGKGLFAQFTLKPNERELGSIPSEAESLQGAPPAGQGGGKTLQIRWALQPGMLLYGLKFLSVYGMSETGLHLPAAENFADLFPKELLIRIQLFPWLTLLFRPETEDLWKNLKQPWKAKSSISLCLQKPGSQPMPAYNRFGKAAAHLTHKRSRKRNSSRPRNNSPPSNH